MRSRLIRCPDPDLPRPIRFPWSARPAPTAGFYLRGSAGRARVHGSPIPVAQMVSTHDWRAAGWRACWPMLKRQIPVRVGAASARATASMAQSPGQRMAPFRKQPPPLPFAGLSSRTVSQRFEAISGNPQPAQAAPWRCSRPRSPGCAKGKTQEPLRVLDVAFSHPLKSSSIRSGCLPAKPAPIRRMRMLGSRWAILCSSRRTALAVLLRTARPARRSSDLLSESENSSAPVRRRGDVGAGRASLVYEDFSGVTIVEVSWMALRRASGNRTPSCPAGDRLWLPPPPTTGW